MVARKGWLAVVALAAVVALSLMAPLSAVADHTNSECALCHGSDSINEDAVMDVGPVDVLTACRKCHLDSLVGTHPMHNAGGDCSSVCHRTWGPSLAANVPMFLTSAGAFAGPSSLTVPTYVLHSIHSSPRWQADVKTTDSACSSCHDTASCEACHNGSPTPDVTHGDHYSIQPTTTPIVPWVGDLSIGVSALQSEDTELVDYPLLCGAAGCHDLAGIVTDAPYYMEVYNLTNASTRFVTPVFNSSGTWSPLTKAGVSNGREVFSAASNARFNLTFTGERVTVYGSTDPYYGIAEILIDNVPVGTINQFSASTQRQRPLWRSADLGPGPHTVSIRNTGTKDPLSRGTYVSIDHIAFEVLASDTITPDCTSCHAAQADDAHGGDHPVVLLYSHDVSPTINATNTWDTGYGVYSCAQCHQAALRTEHRRTSTTGTAVYPDSCSTCHANANTATELVLAQRRTPIAATWTDTYDGAQACSDPDFDTGCHSVSSYPAARVRHALVAPAHAAPTTGQSPACAGCHTSDLRSAHNNPIPGNGKVETNGCLACHSATKLDSNPSCSQVTCHAGGYSAVDTHAIKQASSHVASEAGKPFTRTYQASPGTDDGGVECSVCHSADVVAAHTDSPAVGCSTGGVGGKGCHFDTDYNSMAVAGSGWTTRKCADCHDYLAKQSHDSTATPHIVGNNGCAGTGSSCHNSNDLWTLHLTSWNGTPRPDKGCNVIGCHDTSDRRPTLVSAADSCGSTSPTGCHSSYDAMHVANFEHSFSAVSYYNGATETGCTNQTGCHNMGAGSTVDYGDDHHPISGSACFTSTCHTSPSKAAFSGILPTDCQECHGGGFVGAPSRNALTAAPGSGGHYSETTHTAVGMTAAINAGGSASATCNNCHSPTVGGSSNGLMNQHTSIVIGGSPYGASLTCGECHGDSRAFGASEVAANWTNNTCADCHNGSSSSDFDHAASVPAVAEVGSSCGSTGAGCHNDTDLHSLHKNTAGGCNLTGCHVYSQQSQRPTAKGCGGATSCHTGYTNTSHGIYTNATDATHTASAGMSSVITSGVATAACSACHSAALGAAHATANITNNLGSGHTAWSNLCTTCHNENRAPTASASTQVKAPANWSTNACVDCHTPSYHNTYASGHTGTSPGQGCGATGAGCHNTYDLAALHGVTRANGCQVAGCHDAVNKAMTSAAKSCGAGGGACHSAYTNTSHGIYTNGNDTTHTATAGMTAALTDGVATATCAGCHSATLGSAHATATITSALTSGHTAWANLCTGCHNENRAPVASASTQVKAPANWSTNACVDCHNPSYHDELTTGHVGTGTGCANTGSACHSADLKALHGQSRTDGCALAGCHDSANKVMQSATKSCGSISGGCHATYTASSHGAITGNEATHTAANMTAVLDATYNAGGANTCTTCHSSGLEASHGTSMTGNLTTPAWSSPMCDECHGGDVSPVTGAATVIKTTKWPAKDCEECHGGANGPAKHTEYVSGHVGSSPGHTCVSAGCHSNTWDLRNLHNNPITSNGSTAGCDSAGCHDSQNREMQSADKTCGQGNACHTDKTDANHGAATAHPFTSTSYYSSATETGCTNQAGCHNQTGSDVSNYAETYHPASGCTSGPCHTSASKAGYAANGDCVTCHDANYTGANDRVPVNGAFPAGHYSETTHTAVGMTNTINTAGGSATATCNDCHSPTVGGVGNALANQHTQISIGGSPYGAALSCGECHGDIRARGLTEVTADWTNNTCADCHTGGTTSPLDHTTSAGAVAEVTTTCGSTGVNCHTTTDLHALHKNAAGGCNLTGCHVYTQQAAMPTQKSCGIGGACHTTYTKTTHTHGLGGDAVKHQPSSSVPASDTSYYTTACGACHDMRITQSSLTSEHALATSAKTTAPGDNCANCHNNAASTTAVTNNWSTKNVAGTGAGSSCGVCHQSGSLAIHTDASSTAHADVTSAGCGNTGIGCHNSNDLSQVGPLTAVGTDIHTTCLRCHDRTATAPNLAYNPANDTCGSGRECHGTAGQYNTSTYVHNGGTGAGLADGNDTAHHQDAAMGATMSSGVASATCANCHTGTLATSHATALTGWANTCTSCHNSTLGTSVSAVQVKTGWTNNDCEDCHAIGASATKIPNMHSRYAAGTHDGTSPAGCGATGANCHNTYDLAVLHGQTLTNGCQVAGCHDAVDKVMTSAAKSCGAGGGTCHSTYTNTTHAHTLAGGDAAKHQPSSSVPASDTSYYSTECGLCHDMRTAQSSLTSEHALATSAKTGNANNCLNCHNNAASTTAVTNNWSTKNVAGTGAGSSCGVCHQSGSLAIHADASSTAHADVTSAGCSNSGTGCHNSNDLSQVGSLTAVNTNIHTSCLRCHDRTATSPNVSWNPANDTCGSGRECHSAAGQYDTSTFVHNGSTGAGLADGNDAAHHVDPSMTGTVGNGSNNTCATCHSSGLANSHSTTMTAWANTCTGCHNSALAANVSPTQVKTGWTGDDCLDCHTAGASATKIPNWHSKWSTASHVGTPTGTDTCDGSCHIANYATLDLATIHEDEPLGCKLAGCHDAVDKPMTLAGKTCGIGGACHTTYADGNHGFSATMHTTTDVNSWQNCGRCHLGYRSDYTWNKTFNGHMQIDMQSPVGIDQLHRDASHGGNGCPTCHDGGVTQAKIDAGATANCVDCHVDHRTSQHDLAWYSTKSTSSTNLVKTMDINFTQMDLADFTYSLSTSDNATVANARIEVGPNGAPYSTITTSTTSMWPNVKHVDVRGVDVSSIEGTQPVRLYVWSGSSVTTVAAGDLKVAASRGNMVAQHSADVGAYTCGFGDCHTANTLGWHEDYLIPGTFTGTYSYPALPSRESLTVVTSGATANTFTKVKSLTLNMTNIDKIRLRLNLYKTSTTSTTLQWRVQVGSTILASGNRTNSTAITQAWWDYGPGTDPTGTALPYIDTSAYSGTTTFDLYLSSSSTTTSRRAANSVMQIYSGTRIYNPGTPTDDCEICHQSTIRRDHYGNVQSVDQTLSPFAPKLTGIVSTATPNTDLNAQCDTCHPAWQTGHPQFSHRATSDADGCLSGCHQYSPAIHGTDLGVAEYDLTKQHKWGDNTDAGISYTTSSTISSQAFSSLPTTWFVSNGTRVTNTTGGRTGNMMQISATTTTTDSFGATQTAYGLSNWRGGTFQFWYQYDGASAADYFTAEYATTSTVAATATTGWTPVWRTSTDALTWTQSPVLTVPGDGPVYLRFRAVFNGTAAKFARVDDLVFNGAGRTLPGTMEGGCATNSNGACHAQNYPTSGKCSDCHASINHHNVIHDMSTSGTRTAGVETGYAFNDCIGVCHVKNLHYAHGVGLTETEPRPYRAPGSTVDEIMSCSTCHDSANATVRFTANSTTNTPIADQTLMCATCHTGSAGMASSVHGTASVGTTRTASVLKGVNVVQQFNNTFSVGGHRVPPFTRSWVATNYYWRSGVGWVTTATAGYTLFQFNNHTAAPGQPSAAALLRPFTVDASGVASGTALKNGSNALSTSTVVACADCHGESAASLEGPQGAAYKIEIFDGDNFNTPWKSALFVSSRQPYTLICSRCHDLTLRATASLHNSNSGHRGTSVECVNCHLAVPHAWKRPKLLAFQTDPTQYTHNVGTNTGTSLRNWNGGTGTYTAANTWTQSSRCSASGCYTHNNSTTPVP